jgi:hypothetical protein
MPYKILVGIVSAALMIAYVAPVVIRLKEFALTAVTLLGIAMMLVDLWQSLRVKDD